MKRFALGSLVACALAIAGCGGGHPSKPQLVSTATAATGQRVYHVRLPDGQVVEQAHSPALAEPPRNFALPRPLTGVSTVEQFDSTTVSTVPRSAHYVAGYVNGHWATYWQMLHHWPVVVGISVSTGVGADCFDMEPGNPGPQNAGPWARWQLTQGNSRPCEYSMLSWMPAIRANLAAYGIPVCYSGSQTRCVRLWDAHWTYSRHLEPGYACTQWTDHAYGLNLDESTCATWFYTVAKPPPPPPPPPPAVVYPFAIFATSNWPSPYGPISERLTVEQFAGAYAHRSQYRAYLHGELGAKLHWLAARDAWVATHLYHSWTPYQIGSRRAWLAAYAAEATRA